jgi:hypothetical protein
MVVDLVQVFGTEGYLIDEIREEFLKWLGNPELRNDGFYVDPSQFAEVNDPKHDVETFYEDYDRILQKPWTNEEYPIMAQWLVDQNENLDRLVQASRKEYYFHPLCGDEKLGAVGALLPYAQVVREAARSLNIRVMNEIANDQLEGAISDLAAMRRLGAKLDQSSTLIEHLVGYAVFGIAFHAEQHLLSKLARGGTLSDQAIVGYRAVVQETSNRRDLSACFSSGEKSMMLDGIQRLEQGRTEYYQALPGLIGGPNSSQEVPLQLLFFWTNWSVAADKCQQLYGRIDEALKIEGDQARRIALEKLQAEIEAVGARDHKDVAVKILKLLGGANSRGELAADMMIAMMTPAVVQIEDARMRAETYGITDLGLALELYRRRHGEFPAALADLAPEFIPSVPLDYFSNAAINYQPTDKGYRLWSIGRDRIDQQIDASGKLLEQQDADEGATQPGDDIVLDVK